MTRTALTTTTAVRRRVDVDDGRLVIRTTIVATPVVSAPSSAATVSPPTPPEATPIPTPAARRHRFLPPRQGTRATRA